MRLDHIPFSSLFSITVAMRAHQKLDLLNREPVYYLGVTLLALGSMLVVTSFLALGITGTFLGTKPDI